MKRATLAVLLLVLIPSTRAFAAEEPNHPFKKALISGFVDAEAKPPVPKLYSPCGVAVNLTGTLFVADYRTGKITGAPNLPENPDNAPCALAADPLNLYAAYWHGGTFNPVTGTIDPEPTTGLAVDPETANLYVAHRTSVDMYEAPIIPGAPPALEIGVGSLEDAYGVAISKFSATEGEVYVADAGTNTVKVYDPTVSATDPIREIDGAGTAAGRFVSLVDSSLALDQSNGHLFVVDNTQPGFEHPLAAVSEFNAEGIYRGQLEHTLIFGEPTGITVNESTTPANGDVYVTSGNGSSVVLTPTNGLPPEELGALYDFGPAGKGKKLNASVSGTGSGSVKSSPAGIACPGACVAELNEGGTVLLTATPEPGSSFVGWSGACSGSGTCSVTLNGDVSVDAEFAPAPTPLKSSVATAATQDRAATLAAPAAAGALRLGASQVVRGSGTALLRADVPSAGLLTVTGRGLRRGSVRADGPGPVTLRLRLDRRGRRALATSKSGRLSLRARVSFQPNGDTAEPTNLKRTVSFK
jgi:DNA-binding beta-propeller fold protein YncE